MYFFLVAFGLLLHAFFWGAGGWSLCVLLVVMALLAVNL